MATKSTLKLREKLVAIARKDVGIRETLGKNQGPGIAKFWPPTTYPSGYKERQPYCAAAICYWIREWLRDAEVLAALNLTAAKAEKWRPKTAAAFGIDEWAIDAGLRRFDENTRGIELHTADLVVFDFSHVAMIHDDDANRIYTIEANTGNAEASNEGDGVWSKYRPRSKNIRRFIRILE
jgi:hypothetical protein